MALTNTTQSTLTWDTETAGNGYKANANRTSVSLSTNILIYVGNTAVGAIKQISVNESREVKFFSELGTDGQIDSAPSQSSKVSGECQRIRFDRLRVAEAFGRGFIHARSQAYPFDIFIVDRQREGDGKIVTVLKNVWIKSINTTYSSDDWIISDSMGWEAETIYSTMGTSAKPVAEGGLRKIDYSTINAGNIAIERAVDTGLSNRRGSMDVSGIVDIGGTGNVF